MIIFRYLTREILVTMGAVAGVLLLVIMGSRFIRYFSSAAEGEIPVSMLGTLMLFNLPGFLELILPLAFFLGILLAYPDADAAAKGALTERRVQLESKAGAASSTGLRFGVLGAGGYSPVTETAYLPAASAATRRLRLERRSRRWGRRIVTVS